MSTVDTIAGILHDNLPYQTYVATGRHRRLAEEILAALPMVDTEYLNAAVKRELDWQHYWTDKWQAADLEANRLRRLLNVTSLERVSAVSRLVHSLSRSRTARHDDECWQRHPGCLARRISDLLEGEQVPTGKTPGGAL